MEKNKKPRNGVIDKKPPPSPRAKYSVDLSDSGKDGACKFGENFIVINKPKK